MASIGAISAGLAVVGVLVTGCVTPASKVPAIDIPQAEVERTVEENFRALDPGWQPTGPPTGMVTRSGCATDQAWMPKGPPWKYRLGDLVRDPAPDFMAQVNRGIVALEQKGFAVQPIPEVKDERNRLLKDGRGFYVRVDFRDPTNGPLELSLASWSPCVRHPGD